MIIFFEVKILSLHKRKHILCILYQITVFSFIQDKFPKSQIDVYVTVIEDDGGLLAACITAAGLALCHASIDVYDLVVGSSVVSYCQDIFSLINALVVYVQEAHLHCFKIFSLY